MKRFGSIAKFFVIIFAVLAALSYIVMTVGPLLGICLGIIYAACQSGSTWYLFASTLLIPGLIAVFTSPFMADYAALRRQRKELEDAKSEEMDADR